MVTCPMAAYGQAETLHSVGDGSWSVCARDHRLVFVNGRSAMEVPVDAPLRWTRDGRDITFDEAIEAVPAELHGWMSLAGLIAMRHSLGGLMISVALPGGYHQWGALAIRAEPLCEWMRALQRLDGIDVPDCPECVDDGVSERLLDG